MRVHWVWVLLLWAGLACERKPNDPVLARVGSEVVTRSAFLKEVEGVPFASQTYLRSLPGRRELLDLLIRRKIMAEEAQARPASPEMKEQLEVLSQQYKEQQAHLRAQFLEEQERLRVAHLMKSLKENQWKVTDEEVRSFWEIQKEIRAAHILLSTREVAEAVRKKILAGEPFDVLAKKFSEDTPSAAQGGDVGYLLPGSLVAEFEKALFEMAPGETSNIVVSAYGFHLIRRGDQRPLSAQPLSDELRSRLRQTLESQKLRAWLNRVGRRHLVEVREEALREVVFPSTAPADASGRP